MPIPRLRPPIGTVIRSGAQAASAIRDLMGFGFESWQIIFSLKRESVPPLEKLAEEVRAVIEGTGTFVSALGIYGNPLRDDEKGDESRAALRAAMRAAPKFGTDVIGCFTGRLLGRSIPDSMHAFKKTWSTLATEAADCGVRLAFENCLQGGTWDAGDWNMAHNPTAWEMMFDAVPDACLGLEWEPAHQMCQLIDFLPQLKKWVPKMFHIHGKDANIRRQIIEKHGVYGSERFAWHRLPGFGDSDWSEIIALLRKHGYDGSIDIEGFHDPIWKGHREIQGQVRSLEYLKGARNSSLLV